MFNIERIAQLGPKALGIVIANLADDMCIYCPRERERRCNGDCAAGLAEWLKADVI